jgi:hypothetical protein
MPEPAGQAQAAEVFDTDIDTAAETTAEGDAALRPGLTSSAR